MISDRDRAVIESMCRTGMELDTVKGCFPKFSDEDIETVYNEVRNSSHGDAPDIQISCNCS